MLYISWKINFLALYIKKKKQLSTKNGHMNDKRKIYLHKQQGTVSYKSLGSTEIVELQVCINHCNLLE